MNKRMTDIIYHPVFYFFLLSLLSLLPGSILALELNTFNFLPLSLFYFYILVNQFIESLLLRVPDQDYEPSKKLLGFFESINFLMILFFIQYYSLIAGVILFFYSLIIQLQFLFTYYHLEKTAAFIASLLKVLLLGSFSFYIHLHFISTTVIFYSLGILIPYFIYELTRIKKVQTKYLISTLTFLAFLTAIFILWSRISYFSLFLLLAIPFRLSFSNELNRKNSASFLIIFSGLYALLLSFSSVL